MPTIPARWSCSFALERPSKKCWTSCRVQPAKPGWLRRFEDGKWPSEWGRNLPNGARTVQEDVYVWPPLSPFPDKSCVQVVFLGLIRKDMSGHALQNKSNPSAATRKQLLLIILPERPAARRTCQSCCSTSRGGFLWKGKLYSLCSPFITLYMTCILLKQWCKM